MPRSNSPQLRSIGRRYARGDRGGYTSALRVNYPDGALTDPLFWMGSDSATAVDWSAYGAGLNPPRTSGGGMMHPQYMSSDGILPAVTRATALVVTPTVRTTWRFYKAITGDLAPNDVHATNEEIVRPLWISDPQLLGRIPGGEEGRPTIPRPRRLGGHAFWKTLVCHAVWWGIGAVLFVEDYQGRPLAGTMRIVNPDRWAFTEDGRFVLLGDTGEEALESDFDGGFDVGGVRWSMRTLHNYPPSDGTVAGGALSRSGLVLSSGTKMNSYLNSILSSGVPTGVLRVATPHYTEPQAEALKAQWMAAHGGAQKSIAVLSAGIDFTPLQLNVVDSDVVKAKGQWLVDLAHAFNISAAMLDAATGGSNNITYASLGDRRRDHLDHSLADLGRGVEDLVTSMMPWGQSMIIDWGSYIATDPNQVIPYVTAGLRDGWLTVEEARNVMLVTPIKNPELEGGADVSTDDDVAG